MNSADSGPARIAVFGSFRRRGGIQRRMANVIKEWVRRGVEVDIVSYRGGVCFYPDEIGDWVSFVDLGSRGKWSTLLRLWRYLRNRRPTVVLSAMHSANVIVARLQALPDTGVRRIVSVPNSFGESRKRTGRKQRRKFREVRRLYPRTDGVIAISSGVQRSLEKTIGLRGVAVHCIFNGSVTTENMRRAQEASGHPWLDGACSGDIVVTVGRLAKQKDQCRLIEAVAELRRERDVRLVIVGEGPQREELQAQASALGNADEWLSMPGYAHNPYAFMARADCFVLCSLWEGFPNVLAEALGVGAPVVATDCPSGARDILDNGRYGHLVPTADTAALTHAIRRVLSGDYPRYDVATAVHAFTASAAAERYLEVFGLGDSPSRRAHTLQ